MSTLDAHLERLDALLATIAGAPRWRGHLLAENARVDLGPASRPILVAPEPLCAADAYAPRFDALVARGYAWINLHAAGVFDGQLAVTVELPTEVGGQYPRETSVNLSGPTSPVRALAGWALDHERTGTLTLYRPVGARELALIAESGYRAFPPRLPGQPIFYPVLTEAYAVEIARDWNTRDVASGFAGFVTRFAVDDAFATRYPVQTAGAQRHQELWVPASELAEFNRHIRGPIEVIAEFHGQSDTTDTAG